MKISSRLKTPELLVRQFIWLLISSSNHSQLLLVGTLALFIFSLVVESVKLPASVIFSVLCLVGPIFRFLTIIPSLIFILVFSNFFDPLIPGLSVQNPFHAGLLQIINPNQLFSISATVSLILIFITNYIKYGRLELMSVIYMLVLFMACISAFLGWEDQNERKFQTIFFVLNLSCFYWTYLFVKTIGRSEFDFYCSILFYFGIFGIFLYSSSIFRFVLINTHVSFLLLAFSSVVIFFIFPQKKFILYLVIPSVIFCLVKGVFLLSITTKAVALFGIIFASIVYWYPGAFRRLMVVAVGAVLSIHAAIFVLVCLGQTPFAIDNYYQLGHIAFNENASFLEKLSYKFFLDRLPLWIGALQGIQENFLISPAGTSFLPANFGSFATPERQINWDAGSHNLVLELSNNFGVIGASLYLLFVAGVWGDLVRMSGQNDRTVNLVIVMLMSYFLLPSLIGDFIIQEHSIIAWFIAGALVGRVQSQANEHDTRE